MFKYEKIGDFTYNHLQDGNAIKELLMKWLMLEWEIDSMEFPDQRWTKEWLKLLPKMEFQLKLLKLTDIIPCSDLMAYNKDGYNLAEELYIRAEEREESMLRGISIEPLIINANGNELMDGYTRYMVLKKYNQTEVFCYYGIINE